MVTPRYRIDWKDTSGALAAVEPSDEEVRAAAPALCAAYNEAHNRSMMAQSGAMSVAEVEDYYLSMAQAGTRGLLLYQDGALAGDCDFRHVKDGRAEFAILVAARAAQGKGLGTRFALMAHALAFGPLALDRVYVTIIPANTASLRLFEKLGYQIDDTPAARHYCDELDDISMSVEREPFVARHAAALRYIFVTSR